QQPAEVQSGDAKQWADMLGRRAGKIPLPRPQALRRPSWWPGRESGSCPEEAVANACGWLWWHRGDGRHRDDKPESFDVPLPEMEIRRLAYELLETTRKSQVSERRRAMQVIDG